MLGVRGGGHSWARVRWDGPAPGVDALAVVHSVDGLRWRSWSRRGCPESSVGGASRGVDRAYRRAAWRVEVGGAGRIGCVVEDARTESVLFPAGL